LIIFQWVIVFDLCEFLVMIGILCRLTIIFK